MENFSFSAGSYPDAKAPRSAANLTPRLINTFFLLALQHYFASHPEYKWDPDANVSEIDIHPEYEEDDNLDKGMPVIAVQTGQTSISPAGIGTGMYNSEPRYLKHKDAAVKLNGIWDSQLQMQIDGSIIIYITGASHDDISELAFEIGMFLMMIKYDAAAILQIQNLGAINISPPQASAKVGWGNRYTAQIVIPYVFTVTRIWKPYDAGILLKEVNATIVAKTSKLKHDERFIPMKHIIQPGDTYTDSTIYDKTLPDIEQKTDNKIP